MLTWRFAVHLNRSLVGLLGIVIEKTDVAYLRSFPCIVVKKTFQVTCGDPEYEVGLILSQAGIFGTPKDTDDFTICPTRRSNIGTGVTADLDSPVWQSADNAEPLALGAVLNPSQLMCNHSSHNSHCTTSSQHSGIEQWQNKLVSQVCLLLSLAVFEYRERGLKTTFLQTLN